ncbi:hypothetical protein SERLA73DRAFT_146333, partial [Serpula lacrymans var. lacrymans S7.3]
MPALESLVLEDISRGLSHSADDLDATPLLEYLISAHTSSVPCNSLPSHTGACTPPRCCLPLSNVSSLQIYGVLVTQGTLFHQFLQQLP